MQNHIKTSKRFLKVARYDDIFKGHRKLDSKYLDKMYKVKSWKQGLVIVVDEEGNECHIVHKESCKT